MKQLPPPFPPFPLSFHFPVSQTQTRGREERGSKNIWVESRSTRGQGGVGQTKTKEKRLPLSLCRDRDSISDIGYLLIIG